MFGQNVPIFSTCVRVAQQEWQVDRQNLVDVSLQCSSYLAEIGVSHLFIPVASESSPDPHCLYQPSNYQFWMAIASVNHQAALKITSCHPLHSMDGPIFLLPFGAKFGQDDNVSGCDKVDVLGTGEAGICYFILCCAPLNPAYYTATDTPSSALKGKSWMKTL